MMKSLLRTLAITGMVATLLSAPAMAKLAANGVSINGLSFQGTSFNGANLNGVILNGLQLNGGSGHGQALAATGALTLRAVRLPDGQVLDIRGE